ncbi:MAG TPA: TauD/TfdA family dioxygenase [Steroidobacteraceae bacterium]|nr:TauD/TfdA family dioxygenase [Steroidobacteraceae bacterium]
MADAATRVSATPEALTIEWEHGGVSEFASLWLRDNLREDRDPHSGQRLVDITDLPAQPRIRSARTENGTVHIEWESERHPACFELAWLASRAAGGAERPPELRRRLWLEGARFDARREFAWAQWHALRSDASVRLGLLSRLVQDGIAFVHALPREEAAFLEAMALIGVVAETNYGRVFQVRSVPQPENLAFSDLGLGLHTDNPYREPVPGFQALHALATAPEGGESLFADGFALAGQLRAEAPDDFELLTTTPVPFHYRSRDAELYAERPLIQLSCQGAIAAVHYNSRSIAPLALSAREAPAFYRAYRRFAALLHEPRFQLRLRLADGEAVVFDNQRTLHGRTAFTSAKYLRHLQGCYLTRDSVYSQTALLRRRLGAGLAP